MWIGWPQGVFLFLMVWELIVFYHKDGQMRPYSFSAKVLDYAIYVPLMYWGGFFTQAG